MTHKRTILLVDDCEDTGHLVRVALSSYEVVQAFSVKDAETQLKHKSFSLILIDVGLPDRSGFEFCENLAKNPNLETTPKILLTAEGEVSRKVYGFYCGADDYVVKPFSGPELHARVDARLRTIDKTAKTQQSVCGLTLDFKSLTCVDTLNSSADIKLTPTEFRILAALIANKGEPLSREEIISTIWKENRVHIAKRGLDSHISRLRKKLPSDRLDILSVYTLGYCLQVK